MKNKQMTLASTGFEKYQRKRDARRRMINRARSRVRARVEYAIGVIKRVFGFSKIRYRGIAKNANRLFVTCPLANPHIVRHRLLRLQGA